MVSRTSRDKVLEEAEIPKHMNVVPTNVYRNIILGDDEATSGLRTKKARGGMEQKKRLPCPRLYPRRRLLLPRLHQDGASLISASKSAGSKTSQLPLWQNKRQFASRCSPATSSCRNPVVELIIVLVARHLIEPHYRLVPQQSTQICYWRKTPVTQKTVVLAATTSIVAACYELYVNHPNPINTPPWPSRCDPAPPLPPPSAAANRTVNTMPPPPPDALSKVYFIVIVRDGNLTCPTHPNLSCPVPTSPALNGAGIWVWVWVLEYPSRPAPMTSLVIVVAILSIVYFTVCFLCLYALLRADHRTRARFDLTFPHGGTHGPHWGLRYGDNRYVLNVCLLTRVVLGIANKFSSEFSCVRDNKKEIVIAEPKQVMSAI
ncbi:hypothetical protein PIB30_003285 [Stylosanthes scabra]|uniref:Uncharacterized protein n=1 Tax=Stylosanthes scabra TaxID=79078 RepID=A0ABU6S332_9FABA|nr:hypothetical protein [Stylosanthes scabra]